MPPPTPWAHLPNASLIDALIAALPTCPQAAWAAARDAARDATWDAAWDAAWGAAWGAAWVAAWDAAHDAAHDAAQDTARDAARDAAHDAAQDAAALVTWGTVALVAWDDMPAFIALPTTELEALRKVAKGTDVAHKAMFAQVYNLLTAHTR